MILSTNSENLLAEAFVAKVKPKYRSYPKTIVGPGNNYDSEIAEYKLIGYKYKYKGVELTTLTPAQQLEFDADKVEVSGDITKGIKWGFRVKNNLTNRFSKFVTITNRNLQDESISDFTEEINATKFKEALETKGYLQATKEIVTENGIKINKLTIKFSKWLDNYTVYVEPYRGKPDSKVTIGNTPTVKPYIKATIINATPEIIAAYWLNSQGKRITTVGFETDIKFYIETIGLIDETLKLRLFDYDGVFNPSDSLQWTDGSIEHECVITERKFIQDYFVEEATSTVYANAHSWFDGTLDVFIHLELANTALTINLDDRYANIKFSPHATANIFLGKKEIIKRVVNGIEVEHEQYNKIETVYPGMTAYLVAETANLTGNVTFSITEESPRLVLANEKLPLLVGTNSQTEFVAAIGSLDDYAVVAVKFQNVSEIGTVDTYNDWLTKLMPNDDTIHESSLNIKLVDANANEYVKEEIAKITIPITKFNIFHDGHIDKYLIENAILGEYVFFDENNVSHDLGKIKFHKISNRYTARYGAKYDTSIANLVDIRDFSQYTLEEGPNALGKEIGEIEFTSSLLHIKIQISTRRFYLNEDTFACLVGAMLKCNYLGYGFTGFSLSDGRPGTSTSHKNGYNGDLRYLRTDQSGERLNLSKKTEDWTGDLAGWDDLDKIKQENLMQALYDFGWKSFLSYKYGDNNENLLFSNSTSHDNGHDDHLHMQSFNHNSIIIK